MFREIKNKPVRYFAILLYFVILFFCAIELNFLGLFGYSPTHRDIETPNMRIASELYTADGKLIGKYYKENRTPIEFNQLTPETINALIATEDVRFFNHWGVDIRSVFSSALSTASGDKRGASTITQQLAKNLYRTRNNKNQGLVRYIPGVRTIVYKFKEWITAMKLEGEYSKQEILTLYFNTVPFGNNTFGLKTAAKKYFNKDTEKLSVDQAALLVGMLKASTTYNPQYYPERALERRNVVLSQMEKYNYLDKQEFQKYSSRPLGLALGKVEDDSRGDSYLRSAVARYLEDWAEENGYDLYESGLKIYTTIDSKLQKYAEEAVAEQMKILQRRLDNQWQGQKPWRTSDGKEIENFALKAAQRLPYYDYLKNKYDNNQDSINYYLNLKKDMKVFSWNGEKEVRFSTLDSIEYYSKILNTGMMTLDPFTGHIKVWVGGIDFDHFKFDHVNQSKRQAGSTFKPFAYLAALESGMSPCDRFVDKPIQIAYDENNEHKVWEPKNSDYSFSWQEMTLRHAMGKSVNSITAQITEQVGWDKVVKYAHQVGIESPLKAVPSVSLGSNDVTVFEMVKAYGTFLNKGIKTEPILVKRITDHNGHLIEEFKAEQKRVLSEEIAWLMLYMFRGGMEEPGGTSRSLWEWDLWKKGNQIGGKTGTSSDFVDGWYMGITKDLVSGVWVGADERSVHFRTSGTGEGAHTALPIFGKFMEKVYRDPSTGYTYGPFPKPTVEITREYNCVTPYVEVDTTITDSVFVDSLATPDTSAIQTPVEEPTEERAPQQNNQTERNQNPAGNVQPEEPVDRRTRREINREARRQKRQEQSNN
ncbi:penicillin-binding protein 1A [Pedobacter sp. SYSU D00535]|uniref:penicillin-binding protein 1A n=1 Tax=Pedobacter sp. SYSU D00535 TaxID=2810308 RepID=UPI001A958081|nr:transglycosylase domain-containing protein [Pedobacter sp. SYSU D00535]